MAKVYLIPTVLSDDGLAALPAYILDAVQQCHALYVENERTARRFLKKLDKTIVIDRFAWHQPDPQGPAWTTDFIRDLEAGHTIGIMSDAGCPGIADPGQELVALAHEKGALVRPLAGPSSILLALMGSGLNGQQFEFSGYLPVDQSGREKKIRELEAQSSKNGSAKIFIETPYRNQSMIDSLLNTLQPDTLLCIAVQLTGTDERIVTKKISEWRKQRPAPGKVPVIYLFQAAGR